MPAEPEIPRVPEREKTPSPPPAQVVGMGAGGGISWDDPGEKITRRDTQIVKTTNAKGWHIPDRVKEAALTRLALLIADPHQRPRTQVAAIKALTAIERINVTREAQAGFGKDAGNGEALLPINWTEKADCKRLKLVDGQVVEESAAGESDAA